MSTCITVQVIADAASVMTSMCKPVIASAPESRVYDFTISPAESSAIDGLSNSIGRDFFAMVPKDLLHHIPRLPLAIFGPAWAQNITVQPALTVGSRKFRVKDFDSGAIKALLASRDNVTASAAGQPVTLAAQYPQRRRS